MQKTKDMKIEVVHIPDETKDQEWFDRSVGNFKDAESEILNILNSHLHFGTLPNAGDHITIHDSDGYEISGRWFEEDTIQFIVYDSGYHHPNSQNITVRVHINGDYSFAPDERLYSFLSLDVMPRCGDFIELSDRKLAYLSRKMMEDYDIAKDYIEDGLSREDFEKMEVDPHFFRGHIWVQSVTHKEQVDLYGQAITHTHIELGYEEYIALTRS